MDDINSKLLELDKNFLYGPVGSRMEIIENNACRKLTGQCYERRRDGSGFRLIGRILSDKELTDTFDCQALIVHSSLIKNTNLRFDTNLSWDLYAEDFSIQAKEKFNIDSYAINLKCCHWSGYHTTPDSYYDSLEYINSKYPNLCKAGTVSQIGGIKLPELEMKDYILYKLRKNVKNSFKKDLHTTVNK